MPSIEFEEIALGNIGGVRTADQFMQELRSVIEACQSGDATTTTKDVATGKVVLEVDVEFNQDSLRLGINCSVKGKYPKLRGSYVPVIESDGKLLRELEDDDQVPMFSVTKGGE